MAEASNNANMFANRKFLDGEDIEAGSSNGHVTDGETKALRRESLLEKMTHGENKDWHADEIDKWISSLSRKLDDVPHYMCSQGHPGRISRIPENLREVNARAYEPIFLSVGPYHHDKSRVQPMEKSKWLLLKWVLKTQPELTLKDYLREIKSIEPAARSFYSDVEMESEKFVRMLLLDSLYIVTAFCGMTQSQERTNQPSTRLGNGVLVEDTNEIADLIGEGMFYGDDNDNDNAQTRLREDEPNEDMRHGESNTTRLFSSLFGHDLFLLENQLPFFVLQKMHALVYGGCETPLFDIMKDKVRHLLSAYTNLNTEILISPNEEVHHLLHISHLFFRPTVQQESTSCELLESSQMFRLGSAVQLYEAGVRFEVRSGSTEHCLLDITFSKSGKLAMPCLHVDDNTDSLLRNLIALEQMKYPTMGLDVCAYAVLLLHLVTTPEDVQLLRRKGIIEHHLASDKEMMYLVNRLSVGLSFDYVEDRYSLKPLFHELKRYTERRVPRWKAWLKHRHFSNPWTVISLLAGFVLLFLTALETYYTVYSYYYPCFDCH